MRERSATLRKKTFERDKFTCQKCKIQDKSLRILEAHHIIPLGMEGEDELDNLITLCFDCHRFAPNKKGEFQRYMKEECEGTMTTLVKVWKKTIKEYPNLIKDINKSEDK